LGITLCAGLHFVFIFFAFMFVREMVVAIFGISIVQLAYVLPTLVYLRKRGRTAMAKGLIIGAALTFLLNGACWGWFLLAKPRIGG
jgi:hypothetical protein